MLGYLSSKNSRIREFASNPFGGFTLIWQRSRRLTIINLTLSFLQALLPLLSFILLKKIIDETVDQKTLFFSNSIVFIASFIFTLILMLIVGELSAYYIDLQKQQITDSISKQVLTRSIQLDVEYFENPSFYNNLHVAQRESIEKPGELISSYQELIQTSVSSVLLAAYLFTAHWSIPALLVVLAIPLAFTRMAEGYEQYQFKIQCAPRERMAYDIFYYLTNYAFAKELRIFNFGDALIKRYADLRRNLYVEGKAINRKFTRFHIILQIIQALVVIAIYGIIINDMIFVSASVGGLIVYIASLQRLMGSINGFYKSIINLFQQQFYIQNITALLELPVATQSPTNVKLEGPVCEIRVENLSFVYPQTKELVLDSVSFNFRSGNITAIVGENGSGKSTLIKLLSRLYEVEHGSIFVNNYDIKCIEVEDLRSRFSILFQDFEQYNFTVGENISFDLDTKDEERLESSVQKSGFISYIKRLPLEFDTPAGRAFAEGRQFSGGQWQKLGISRLFYKKSEVLILDEPTSSLDASSEYALLNILREECRDKIVILVTHRLSTLKIADSIYVMDRGKVIEQGDYHSLLSHRGHFYESYKTQIA